MLHSDTYYIDCAYYLIHELEAEATEYALTKALTLLDGGDRDGAFFWTQLYLHIGKAERELASMPSRAVH